MHIIGIPEGQEREKGIENIFEGTMAENFPNLEKETDTQVQEAQSPKQGKPKQTYAKTLNVNGLNAPVKRHRVADRIKRKTKKQEPAICCL